MSDPIKKEIRLSIKGIYITILSILGILILVGFGIGAEIIDLRVDTSLITNVVFATNLAIASASFGYARLLEANTYRRTIVSLGGENFFLSSILFMFFSIIKWTVRYLANLTLFSENNNLLSALNSLAYILFALILIMAVYFAFIGLQCILFVFVISSMTGDADESIKEKNCKYFLENLWRIKLNFHN